MDLAAARPALKNGTILLSSHVMASRSAHFFLALTEVIIPPSSHGCYDHPASSNGFWVGRGTAQPDLSPTFGFSGFYHPVIILERAGILSHSKMNTLVAILLSSYVSRLPPDPPPKKKRSFFSPHSEEAHGMIAQMTQIILWI